MTAGMPISCALLGLVVVAMLVPILLRVCRRTGWLCRSTDFHHLHAAQVPRLGGLVLVIAGLLVQGWMALRLPAAPGRGAGQPAVIFCSLAMFLLGFWDDIHPLTARTKLLGQVLIAAAVWVLGTRIQWLPIPLTGRVVELGPWGFWITVVWLVGMTNLVNLVDGIDGLAGGISLFAVVLITLVGWHTGMTDLLTCGLAGALLGFLLFNFPPARIFLGDGGAYFVGFQIGLCSILNSRQGMNSAVILATLLVLAVPIGDALLAVLRRGLLGLPVLRPDRQHIHHLLLRRGLTPRRAVLRLYAVTLLMLGAGMLSLYPTEPRGLLCKVIVMILAALWLGRNGAGESWRSLGRFAGEALRMRRGTQYGLAIAHWLELAAARTGSWEEIWGDLVFAAGKLGFASVHLTFPGGERSWATPLATGATCTGSFRFAGSFPCQLTLSAPAVDGRQRREFELLGELLAEGWGKAIRRWAVANRVMQPSPGMARRTRIMLATAWESRLTASTSSSAPALRNQPLME